MDKVAIFGVNINNIGLKEASKYLEKYLQGNKLKTIYTPNTEIIMATKDNERMKDLLNKADLLVPDGIGLVYASRMRNKPLKERVTGFDLSLVLLDMANQFGYNIYLLGGKEGVAKKAADNIKKRYKNLNIAGYHHGYFSGNHTGVNSQEEKKIIDEINGNKAHIIFVGLGFPRQELWIDKNKDRLRGKIIIGNGGVIDVLAGETKRAPVIFQKLYLEWFYRLIQEPARIKRQLAIPRFIFHILFNKNMIN